MIENEETQPNEQQKNPSLEETSLQSTDLNETTKPDNFGIEAAVNQDILYVKECAHKIRSELEKVIVGQKEYINGLILALLTDGHVLVEGVPGIAKTLTAKLMAKTLDVDFSRIQFTPDLMPADVTGTSIFNVKKAEFEFKKGPIFSNIILIDEINRAPAKTQSSLFEVMEEKQVTVDGHTYQMEEPFLVLATQNPIEQEGTYKLPEAQMDRFMFRIIVDYPNQAEEYEMLKRFEVKKTVDYLNSVKAVLKPKEIEKCRSIVSQVNIGESLIKYIANIMSETRNNPDLFLGASPRASLALMNGSKTMAAIMGRDFVTPDDIKYISFWTMNHRIQLSADKEMEGMEIKEVLNNIFESIEIPR